MKKTILMLCVIALCMGLIGTLTAMGEESEDAILTIDMSIDPNDARFNADSIPVRKNSPLEGKTIYWLGSSVVVGEMAEQNSMVEYLAARNNMVCVKEAVSGTTLKSAKNAQDYVNRLITSEVLDKDAKIDAFICQISTNDVLQKKKWGKVSAADVTALDQFDLGTSMGGVEYIIEYVHETWNCPIYFFSGSYYGTTPVNGYVRDAFWNSGDDYAKLVALVQQAVDKWNAIDGYDVRMIDLYNDEAFNASITTEEYQYLMNEIFRGDDTYADDPIHPLKAGYLQWWTPYFERFLEDALGAVE